jgi:ATP-dependent Zn protease
VKRTAGQLRRTAIHEAGHAVIGRVLKQVCGCVTIVPNEAEGEAGYFIIGNPYQTMEYWWEKICRFRGSDDMTSILRGRIMTYMAGRVAEEEFFGKVGFGCGLDDREIALGLGSLLGPDADLKRYEARLRAFTRGLVKRHRPAIERVAAALLKRKTLQPEEIERAMAAKTF